MTFQRYSKRRKKTTFFVAGGLNPFAPAFYLSLLLTYVHVEITFNLVLNIFKNRIMNLTDIPHAMQL